MQHRDTNSITPLEKSSSVPANHIVIGDNHYRCGIPVLSKEQAALLPGGLPFDLAVINKIISENKENANVMTLAKNIHYFMTASKQALQDEKNIPETTTCRAKSVQALLDEGYPVKLDNSARQAQFHCGDIVSYAASLEANNPNCHIAVLNPANAKLLGGGAFIGAAALEEIFIRCSTFGFALIKHAWQAGDFEYKVYGQGSHARPTYHQPMEKGEAWYTNNVVFHQAPHPSKKDAYQRLPQEFKVAIISSAAPSYKHQNEAAADPNNEKIIKEEFRAMLTAAVKNQIDIFVLTAFGCGAFNNVPEKVANHLWEVLYLEGYAKFFKQIHLAIWNDPNPKMPQNFEAFKEVFTKRDEQVKLSMPTFSRTAFIAMTNTTTIPNVTDLAKEKTLELHAESQNKDAGSKLNMKN